MVPLKLSEILGLTDDDPIDPPLESTVEPPLGFFFL
jgi:hypothetical protein